MFVIEDPARSQGERERWLQRSRVNAYVGTLAHERRRQKSHASRQSGRPPRAIAAQHRLPLSIESTVAVDHDTHSGHAVTQLATPVDTTGDEQPSWHDQRVLRLTPPLNFTPQVGPPWRQSGNAIEARSLQFFLERTCMEWSGWHDSKFWNELALQVASSHLNVQYALASLGAYHESLETTDPDQRLFLTSFAIGRARKALDCLIVSYDNLPFSAILATYVVITTALLLMEQGKFYSLLKLQCNMLEQYQRQSIQISQFERHSVDGYLKPIIERQKAQAGSFIDFLYNLRAAPASQFSHSSPVTIPANFTSVHHARSTLESLLEWAVHAVKTNQLRSAEVQSHRDCYLRSLSHYLYRTNVVSEQDRCNTWLLKLAAHFGTIMIDRVTKNEDDELFFDAYTPLYAEFADCFRRVIQLQRLKARRKDASRSFGVDGMLSLAGQVAARWCRDPKIRRDIIRSLFDTSRREGNEDSGIWGNYCEAIMQVEEQGLTNPKTCHEIPLQNRVKVHLSTFLPNQVHHIQYFVYPWGHADTKDIYIRHHTEKKSFEGDIDTADGTAFMIVGRGYCSVRDSMSPSGYHTLKDLRFFFPIPSV